MPISIEDAVKVPIPELGIIAQPAPIKLAQFKPPHKPKLAFGKPEIVIFTTEPVATKEYQVSNPGACVVPPPEHAVKYTYGLAAVAPTVD